MNFPKNLICFSLFSALLFAASTHAAHFDIVNQCPFTLWAAAVPGGGRQLNTGETWPLDIATGTAMARIWARTGCTFDANGQGRCETGDCGGRLECTAWGVPPATLAEYTLAAQDTVDISLVEGFNVPMNFLPIPAPGGICRDMKCGVDINSQCPNELRAPGGCKNPCSVYNTQQYCCNEGPCGPTPLSKFFKDRCPDAYSYPQDDRSSTVTCPSGTNYRVVFCPGT